MRGIFPVEVAGSCFAGRRTDSQHSQMDLTQVHFDHLDLSKAMVVSLEPTFGDLPLTS